jgi:uncharacterized protein YacL
MLLLFLRALFVLLMTAVGYFYLKPEINPFGPDGMTWASISIAVVVSLLVLVIDILSSRRKLLALSGVLFGLLVGLFMAFMLGYIVQWLVEQFMFPNIRQPSAAELAAFKNIIDYTQFLLKVVCCYLSISFIMQTKDDVRFIIPYVEFAKQTKGARPMLLDSSVLIDGRIRDVADLGLIVSRLVVPRFVLDELQSLADCTDRLKRNRGRRGLDVVAKLQSNRNVDVTIYEGMAHHDESKEVDQKLVALAAEMEGRLVTTDYNLSKVAQLRGVDVINLNDVALAMKSVVLAGERITIQIIRPGEQAGQGVGYLEDGTMVVIEGALDYVGGPEIEATVTNVIQSATGRMVFGKLGEPTPPPRRGHKRSVPAEPQAPAS